MKKRRPFQISFYEAGSGWILLKLDLPEKTIKIHLSSVFDPFDDLLNWLEDICIGYLPSEITIDEEGYGKRLIANVLTRDAKDSFVLTIFDWATRNDKLLVKSELGKKEFILTFANRLGSFIERKPNINWSSYSLSELPIDKLRDYYRVKQ